MPSSSSSPDAGPPRGPSRRHVLQAGLAGAAGVPLITALTGCGSGTSISSDPDELVLWYWNRLIDPTFLTQAAIGIPGTSSRLRADVIGGAFDTKLRTSFAAQAYIPDITAVNSNAPLYFPNEDQFIDLDELGADQYKDQYYPWKWELGRAPSGRLIFWPLDIGPTGYFYRSDLMAAAGLPSEPDDFTAATRTWEEWIDLGRQLRAVSDTPLVGNAATVFNQAVNASPERFFDKDDRPLFEDPGSGIRAAWDAAVAASKARVTGNLQNDTDLNAAWTSGKVAGHIEGAWFQKVLSDAAPDLAGRWRIAQQPGAPGNSGGSFLGIPRSSKNPQAAMAFASWMNSPDNQAVSWNDIQVFPSTPGSLTSGRMLDNGTFFGGQDLLAYFSSAAEGVPETFISPYENQTSSFGDELRNVESSGKDPEQAWDDAVTAVNKLLSKRGVI